MNTIDRLKNKLPKIEEYLENAKGIAWDTCHKIYVLMDDNQVALMRSYGYGDENDLDSLTTSDEISSEEMLGEIIDWWDRSCGLRFIQAVHTTPNGIDEIEGFVDLIPQSFQEEEDE